VHGRSDSAPFLFPDVGRAPAVVGRPSATVCRRVHEVRAQRLYGASSAPLPILGGQPEVPAGKRRGFA